MRFPDAEPPRFNVKSGFTGFARWVSRGFLDLNRRHEGLDSKKDPLVTLAQVIPWELFRPKLLEALFGAFDGYLREHGFLAMGGQIIDATIVAAPRQRNNSDDNDSIKRGETLSGWKEHPAKRRQKDVDARWTKKHRRTYFGYKNHISMDQRHKLVRTIGLVRAKMKIGMQNLTYNMSRFVHLQSPRARPA